jgi:hypothetical protein
MARTGRPDRLRDVDARLARAGGCVVGFRELAAEVLESSPFRVERTSTSDGASASVVYRVVGGPDVVPEELGVLLSEFVHCMTRALDHLAFALSETQADLDYRSLTAEEAAAIRFPIVLTSESDFRSLVEQHHAVYAGADLVEFLEGVQPYRDFASTHHPLAHLADLEQEDREHVVSVVGCLDCLKVPFDDRVPDPEFSLSPGDVLVDGTEVIRFATPHGESLTFDIGVTCALGALVSGRALRSDDLDRVLDYVSTRIVPGVSSLLVS